MKIGKYKISAMQLMRSATQILFFVFLPALYIGSFNGVKQIYLAVLHQDFNVMSLLPQIVEAIAIIPVTILLGRFFCGWMCAFGAMGDFISLLSLKVFRRKFRISEKTDKLLKYVKYVLLAFLIVAVWTMGATAFSASNPWDAFGMLFTVGQLPDLSYTVSYLTPALVILALIVLASFFVERFFCRYLCPLGAVFALVSKLRITSIRKPTAKCGNCRICTRSCPMGISLYQNDVVRSAECIDCLSCVSACPRKNVSLAVSGNDVRPALAGAMTVAAMTGIYYVGSAAANAVNMNATAISATSEAVESSAANNAFPPANTPSLPSTAKDAQSSASQSTPSPTVATSAPSAGQYKDGTYEGSGTGFRGRTTTVSVTVQGGDITDITIVSTGDDGPFVNRAFPVVSRSIIESQSADVNAVSGATYTSRGIMQAVADALSNAD